MDSESRQCQNCKEQFTIEPDDFAFYEKMNVPPPTFCWLCRAERRFSFRNERNLYKRKSDFSGKEIFSMYPPDADVKVYEKDVWLGDGWDPMQYGRDYDFSRPFFEQFKELLRTVPLKNLNIVNGVNSDYCNHFTNPKNCYLAFNANDSEDCLYSNGLTHVRDCVDVSHVGNCENCYEGFWLTSCARTYFSSNCENCLDVAFSKNCVGCTNCFGCVGLRKKSYCIWNEQYSKEEYEKKIVELNRHSAKNIEALKKRARAFWNKFPVKYIEGMHNTGVSGNYIYHSKNVKQSFLVREGENLRYCQYVSELPGSKNSYDFSIWGDNVQYAYECAACGIGVNNVKFSAYTQEQVHDIEYSYACSGSSNLFGCVGLRKKEYCILNKQYSKNEYEALAAKIREHMTVMPYISRRARPTASTGSPQTNSGQPDGEEQIVYRYGEFFPIEISPWAYNETIAFDYFPKTKKEAVAKGFRWRDVDKKKYETTMQPEALPDTIGEVQDTVTNEVIGCAHAGTCNHQCATAFKIIPQELRFYRKNGIPLPRLCPICRHYERLLERSKLRLYPRTCQCSGAKSENGIYQNAVAHAHGASQCPNTFETTYPPEKPDIVYCEQCYQAEIA